MDTMLTDILCVCKKDEVFDFLLKYAGSAKEQRPVEFFISGYQFCQQRAELAVRNFFHKTGGSQTLLFYRGFLLGRFGGGYEFEGDMADFIGRQTQTLLGRGEPLLALRAGIDALREFASSRSLRISE